MSLAAIKQAELPTARERINFPVGQHIVELTNIEYKDGTTNYSGRRALIFIFNIVEGDTVKMSNVSHYVGLDVRPNALPYVKRELLGFLEALGASCQAQGIDYTYGGEEDLSLLEAPEELVAGVKGVKLTASTEQQKSGYVRTRFTAAV